MGNNQIPFQGLPPAVKAQVARLSENATVSSMVQLGANTTSIEISTQGTSAAFRWVTAANAGASVAATSVIALAGASANFDHIIAPNSVRRFVIPIEVNNPQGYSSMVGLNVENGLFQWVAWKTQGVASVYMNEYGNSNNY